MPVELQIHLAVVVACALAVVTTAMTVRGSREDRIQQIIISAAITFGGYALVILFGRVFFLRTALAAGIFGALILSAIIVWVRQQRGGVKVAVIAPLVKSVPPGLAQAALIVSPAAAINGYDILLVDLHEPMSGEWARALSRAMLGGTRVRHVQEYVEEARGKASIEHFEIDHLPATEADSYIQVKRLMDIAGAVLLLTVAVPLIAVSAMAILLTNGWPVFFIQERVGLGGKPFRMWKLRTMHVAHGPEAEEAARPDDDRIIGVGRFLRRCRLDELPQIWNVLKGEMSLIGPRPEAVALHTRYTDAEPKFSYRTLVRPGITGWAQINAPASASVHEALRKLRYDLYYVKKQSLSLDIQIGLKTIWVVLRGLGSR